MSVRFDLFFDADFSYYRARFWGDGVDTIRKVPDAFWKSLGHRSPAEPSPKFEKLAFIWAARFAENIVEDMGRAPRTREMTLPELIEFFIRSNPNDAKAKTIIKYKTMKVAIVGHFNGIEPSQITKAKAQEYRNVRTKTVRNRTARNELDFLLQVIRWGYENRIDTGMNEINLMKRPKVAKQTGLNKPLTKREVAAITLVKLPRDGDRIVRLVLEGIATGLRRTPLLNYRLEWANRETCWLDVPAEIMKGRKGEERALSVPMSSWAIELLPADKIAGLAFPRKNGRANVQVDRSLWKISTLAGIRRFSLQSLRMTFLSILANAGVEKPVREILVGHVAEDVSEEFYIRRHPDVLRAAVAKMDEYRDEIMGIARELRSEQTRRNGLRSVG